MKNLLFTLLLFFTRLSPRYLRYYETATGTSYTLKTQLYTIIKGHTDNGYGGLILSIKRLMLIILYDGTVLDMYSENQTEPILIIIQGLHNDVVTILRKGLLQQRTYHSTIHLAHGFRCHHFITPTDGKVNGQRSSYMEQWVPLLDFAKRKQIRF
jgi:hypothetical protein